MDFHDEKTRAQRTERIRELNDRLRTTGEGGRTLVTRAVSLSGPEATEALSAIRKFDAFTPDNDQYGEHDFGQVKIEGTSYFWKIDYYDIEIEFGSPDPADETITCRVLTIMTAGDL